MSRRSKKPKIPMPSDWQLDARMREYAELHGMSPRTIAFEFHACQLHHHDSLFTPWGWAFQTWQTWVLNWVRFGRKQIDQAAAVSNVPAAYQKTAPAYPEQGCEMPEEVRDLLARIGRSMASH